MSEFNQEVTIPAWSSCGYPEQGRGHIISLEHPVSPLTSVHTPSLKRWTPQYRFHAVLKALDIKDWYNNYTVLKISYLKDLCLYERVVGSCRVYLEHTYSMIGLLEQFITCQVVFLEEPSLGFYYLSKSSSRLLQSISLCCPLIMEMVEFKGIMVRFWQGGIKTFVCQRMPPVTSSFFASALKDRGKCYDNDRVRNVCQFTKP